MNDEDIIDLFFDRKESAIFETDNKYGNHLSKLAMRILNCHEDAEDCKNDTYFETWNTVPPTRPTNFLAIQYDQRHHTYRYALNRQEN